MTTELSSPERTRLGIKRRLPFRLRLLFVGSLGSILLPVQGRTDTVPIDSSVELSSLRAEVAVLRAELAESTSAKKELEAQNTRMNLDLSVFRGAVALASNGAPARRKAAESPSSSLGWSQAIRAATAATLMVDGSSLISVMPTGSMEPMFNERAILLVEPARFEDLKVGDVVTYRNQRIGLLVVHRILEKRGDRFWSKGDNNGRMDQVYITRENYGARVFGIIYAREPSEQSQRFSKILADQ